MKSLIVLCAAIAISVVATFLVITSQKDAQYNRERELLKAGWDAERAELEAAIDQIIAGMKA